MTYPPSHNPSKTALDGQISSVFFLNIQEGKSRQRAKFVFYLLIQEKL